MAKKTPTTKPKATKPVVKRKAAAATKATATKQTATSSDKYLTLQQQIEALEKRMLELDRELITELKAKLVDAKEVVRILEAELAMLTRRSSSKHKAKRMR